MDNLKNAGAKLLNAVADEAEIVKDIYDDGLKPTVQEAGKIISFPLELINAMLTKPRCWIANAEYKLKETNILIAEKLTKLEKEMNVTLTPPEDYVAVPALQALSYSIDSKELRELYANLLAKAMCKDIKDKVHPAFVEIIKQLNPVDVKIFNLITTKEKRIATKQIYIDNIKEKTRFVVLPVATSIEFSDISSVSSSLYNLTRCGLIEKNNQQNTF